MMALCMHTALSRLYSLTVPSVLACCIPSQSSHLYCSAPNRCRPSSAHTNAMSLNTCSCPPCPCQVDRLLEGADAVVHVLDYTKLKTWWAWHHARCACIWLVALCTARERGAWACLLALPCQLPAACCLLPLVMPPTCSNCLTSL